MSWPVNRNFTYAITPCLEKMSIFAQRSNASQSRGVWRSRDSVTRMGCLEMLAALKNKQLVCRTESGMDGYQCGCSLATSFDDAITIQRIFWMEWQRCVILVLLVCTCYDSWIYYNKNPVEIVFTFVLGDKAHQYLIYTILSMTIHVRKQRT